MHGSRPPLSVVRLLSGAVSETRHRVTLRRAPHRAREVMALLDGGLLAALTVSLTPTDRTVNHRSAARSHASRSINTARADDGIRISRKDCHRHANQEARDGIFHFASPTSFQPIRVVWQMNDHHYGARPRRFRWCDAPAATDRFRPPSSLSAASRHPGPSRRRRPGQGLTREDF
jgi:hypothetical protein